MRDVASLIKHTYDREGVIVVVYNTTDEHNLREEIASIARSAGLTIRTAPIRGWPNKELLEQTRVVAQPVYLPKGMLVLPNLGVYTYPNLKAYRSDRTASEYRSVYVFGILSMVEDPSTWDEADDDLYYARRYGDALGVPAYVMDRGMFVLRHEPGRGQGYGKKTTGVSTTVDLALINEHRRGMGMRPLDPVAAGWTEEDVVIEAKRIRKLNPLKESLMSCE